MIGLVRHLLTSPLRHHRSGGFGIHSPSAFAFVTGVLREKLPYYAYEPLAEVRRQVHDSLERHDRRRLITTAKAQMLLRITNHFGPQRIAQIGEGYGVTEMAMLLVSGKSQLQLCGSGLAQVLAPLAARITRHDTPAQALAEQCDMVLVNDLCGCGQDEIAAAQSKIFAIIDGGGIVVLRHLHTSAAMQELWQACKGHLTEGHTFSNDKEAVIVPGHRPLEHFALWF